MKVFKLRENFGRDISMNFSQHEDNFVRLNDIHVSNIVIKILEKQELVLNGRDI